jgi:hypothetical protein
MFDTISMNSASPYAITIHPAVDGSILAPFHPFIRGWAHSQKIKKEPQQHGQNDG